MSIEEQINLLKLAINAQDSGSCMRLTLSYAKNQFIDVDILEHALATILLAKDEDDDFPTEEYYLSFIEIFKALLTRPGWNNLALIVDGECLWLKFANGCAHILLGLNFDNLYLFFEDNTEDYIKDFSVTSRTLLPNFLTAIAKLDGDSREQIEQYRWLKQNIIGLLAYEEMRSKLTTSNFTDEQLELSRKFTGRFNLLQKPKNASPTEFILAYSDDLNVTRFDPWKPLLANYQIPDNIEEVLQRLNTAIINQDTLTTARLTRSLDINIQLSVNILEQALMTLVTANGVNYKCFSYKKDYVSFALLLCALFAKPEWENYALVINGVSLWTKLNEECKNILLGDAVYIHGLKHNDDKIIEKLSSVFDSFKPKVLTAISDLTGNEPKTNEALQKLKEEISSRLLEEIGISSLGTFEKMSEEELATYWNFIGKFGNFSPKEFRLHKTIEACTILFNFRTNIKLTLSAIVQQCATIYPGQQQSALITAACSKQPQVRAVLFCIKIKFEHEIKNPDLDRALEQALQMLIANSQISLITKGDELETILSFLCDFAHTSGTSVTKNLYLKLNSYVQAQINLQPALGTYIDLKKHGFILPERRLQNSDEAPQRNANRSSKLLA